MAKTFGQFKSATIYKYVNETSSKMQNQIGNYLELLPRSLYKKEYGIAFEKVNSILPMLNDITFKEFSTSSFSIISNLFTSSIQTEQLLVKNELIFDNLSETDPNIKGALYRKDNQLLISLGKKK